MILDPGFNLTLRPMKYPQFFKQYQDAIKNTWTVQEVKFSTDVNDLATKMTVAERHMIHKLVAFFATGDSIVSNNLVLSLYDHINAPEARLYLSRQLFEEAQHIEFYLLLLDTYIPDSFQREEAFRALEEVESIKRKADFCFKWIDSVQALGKLDTDEKKQKFLLNLICFACCVEGLFFFGAFAYVYFLKSKGLLNGLSSGTNWVFRDETAHMNFAFSVIEQVRKESPEFFTSELEAQIREMISEAVDCEIQFAKELLSGGVAGLSIEEMTDYLKYTADSRLSDLGYAPMFNAKNPLTFMEMQDIPELANFFERTPTAYQFAVGGEVSFGEDF